MSICGLGRIQALCFSPSSAHHISFDRGHLQFKFLLVPFSRTMHEVCLKRCDAKIVNNGIFLVANDVPCQSLLHSPSVVARARLFHTLVNISELWRPLEMLMGMPF